MIKIDSVERHLFLEGIFIRYGYDFRQYSPASFDRRLQNLMTRHGHQNLYDTLRLFMTSPEDFRAALPELTVSTSEFFRDPEFFLTVRKQILPVLKTYPSLSFWIAGCSTGQEVISLCILLKEEDLYHKSTIFATDINSENLKTAKTGIYSAQMLQAFAKGYLAAGGTGSPSDYYTADYGLARFDPALLENVSFQEHNLVTDSVFSENHLILCRNVMIYFNKELQDKVFKLFTNSLVYRGFLGIGSKETLRFASSRSHYEATQFDQHIYQLKAQPKETSPLSRRDS